MRLAGFFASKLPTPARRRRSATAWSAAMPARTPASAACSWGSCTVRKAVDEVHGVWASLRVFVVRKLRFSGMLRGSCTVGAPAAQLCVHAAWPAAGWEVYKRIQQPEFHNIHCEPGSDGTGTVGHAVTGTSRGMTSLAHPASSSLCAPGGAAAERRRAGTASQLPTAWGHYASNAHPPRKGSMS